MNGTRVHIATHIRDRYAEQRDEDPFDTYPPPVDLTSDMLLTGATCAAGPIAQTFPDRNLWTVGGNAFLGIWFSRIENLRAGPQGRTRVGPEEAPQDLPYQELNVAVLLRNRRLLVPGIYATSELTLRLGHRYGMPKELAEMTYDTQGSQVASRATVHGVESRAEARRLPLGKLLGAVAARTLPWWSWPVEFPSGSSIRGYVEGAQGAEVMRLPQRRLALNEPWLPHPARVWPLALRIPAQIMRLPAP